MGLLIVGQLLQFAHEIALVFELPIDRGKTNIGHIVESSQMGHHALTNLLGENFLFVKIT